MSQKIYETFYIGDCYEMDQVSVSVSFSTDRETAINQLYSHPQAVIASGVQDEILGINCWQDGKGISYEWLSAPSNDDIRKMLCEAFNHGDSVLNKHYEIMYFTELSLKEYEKAGGSYCVDGVTVERNRVLRVVKPTNDIPTLEIACLVYGDTLVDKDGYYLVLDPPR